MCESHSASTFDSCARTEYAPAARGARTRTASVRHARRRRIRSAAGAEGRVEQDLERAEGLPAPFGPETEEDDMPGIELHIQCRRLAIEMLLTDEVTGQQRRSGILILRERLALESLLR